MNSLTSAEIPRRQFVPSAEPLGSTQCLRRSSLELGGRGRSDADGFERIEASAALLAHRRSRRVGQVVYRRRTLMHIRSAGCVVLVLLFQCSGGRSQPLRACILLFEDVPTRESSAFRRVGVRAFLGSSHEGSLHRRFQPVYVPARVWLDRNSLGDPRPFETTSD